MIRFIAKSLGGGEHIIRGRIKNRDEVPYDSVKDGYAHLAAIGWTDIRHAVDREWSEDKKAWRIVWSDQRITFNWDGSADFWYETGRRT